MTSPRSFTDAARRGFGQSGAMANGDDSLASSYSVGSARDLITVVTSLRSDLIERPEEWENVTLERFLDAMAAWLAAFPQSYIDADESVLEPEWRFVADLLRAARIYE